MVGMKDAKGKEDQSLRVVVIALVVFIVVFFIAYALPQL